MIYLNLGLIVVKLGISNSHLNQPKFHICSYVIGWIESEDLGWAEPKVAAQWSASTSCRTTTTGELKLQEYAMMIKDDEIIVECILDKALSKWWWEQGALLQRAEIVDCHQVGEIPLPSLSLSPYSLSFLSAVWNICRTCIWK